MQEQLGKREARLLGPFHVYMFVAVFGVGTLWSLTRIDPAQPPDQPGHESQSPEPTHAATAAPSPTT